MPWDAAHTCTAACIVAHAPGASHPAGCHAAQACAPHTTPCCAAAKARLPTRPGPGARAVAPPPTARPELSEPAGFLEREIASTQKEGQLFVVASGNSGVDLDAVPLYPTSYKTDNMISVASSGANDYVSTFSNLGL